MRLPPGADGHKTSSVCIVISYTTGSIMPAEKTVSISFRVSPRFKSLLEEAAARENRSLTNMFETLVIDHCEQNGLVEPSSNAAIAKGVRK